MRFRLTANKVKFLYQTKVSCDIVSDIAMSKTMHDEHWQVFMYVSVYTYMRMHKLVMRLRAHTHSHFSCRFVYVLGAWCTLPLRNTFKTSSLVFYFIIKSSIKCIYVEKRPKAFKFVEIADTLRWWYQCALQMIWVCTKWRLDAE